MNNYKLQTTATVEVRLSVTLSQPWDKEAKAVAVYRRAENQAVDMVAKMLEQTRDIRLLGAQKVTAVISHKEAT